MRLLELGNLVKSRLDVRDLAVKPMQELHKLTAHPVSLFVRQDDDALCIERTVAERNGVQVTRVMGLRVPLTSSAAGKTLLIGESGSALGSLASAQNARLESLQAELNTIRQNSLAHDGDGHDPASQMVAAPIFNDLGEVVASLALNSPSSRMTSEWSEALKVLRNAFRCKWAGKHVKTPHLPTKGLRQEPFDLGETISRSISQDVTFWLFSPLIALRWMPLRSSGARARHQLGESTSPAESRNTKMNLRPAMRACMTRQRPASTM